MRQNVLKLIESFVEILSRNENRRKMSKYKCLLLSLRIPSNLLCGLQCLDYYNSSGRPYTYVLKFRWDSFNFWIWPWRVILLPTRYT